MTAPRPKPSTPPQAVAIPIPCLEALSAGASDLAEQLQALPDRLEALLDLIGELALSDRQRGRLLDIRTDLTAELDALETFTERLSWELSDLVPDDDDEDDNAADEDRPDGIGGGA